MFLNAGAALDFKTVEEYKIYITCTGTSSTESFLTVRILDKSVTTPYTVPGMTFNNKLSSKCSLPGREKKTQDVF